MTKAERRALEERCGAVSVLGLRIFEANGSLTALRRHAERHAPELVQDITLMQARLGQWRGRFDDVRTELRIRLHPPKPVDPAMEGFDG